MLKSENSSGVAAGKDGLLAHLYLQAAADSTIMKKHEFLASHLSALAKEMMGDNWCQQRLFKKELVDKDAMWTYLAALISPSVHADHTDRELFADRCLKFIYDYDVNNYHAYLAVGLSRMVLEMMGKEWYDNWIYMHQPYIQNPRKWNGLIRVVNGIMHTFSWRAANK